MSNVELTVVLTIAELVFIILCQQNHINQMEDKVFHSLKVTCETLNLIKKDCTLEEILELGKKNSKTKSK